VQTGVRPLGDDRDRELDPPLSGVVPQHHLLHRAVRGDDQVDVLDGAGPRAQLLVHRLDEPPERVTALDPAAHRVVELRLAREGPHQRVHLARQDAVEERDGDER
jgi:hypothetical protein